MIRSITALLLAIAMLGSAAPLLAQDSPPVAPKTLQEEHWPDGKLQRTEELLTSGSKSVVYYDHDGKTIVLKQEFRKDGTLAYQRHRLVDGSTVAIRYKTSGDKQMMRTHNPKTGAFVLTHFRTGKSKDVWFKADMDLSKSGSVWQCFTKSGTTIKRVITDKDMTVTVSDAKGKIEFIQLWNLVGDKWQLQSVTDPNASQRFNFKYNKAGVLSQDSLENLKADGSVDSVDAIGKQKAPAGWLLDGFDDDPTFPE